MTDEHRHIIKIPEITRVEGHSAVVVDLKDGQVSSVKLDVFEGIRFFEKIVVGHKFHELPHITARVCAICSTGHVLAAIRSIEETLSFEPNELLAALRRMMHLGMIIESHATHLFALVLPDYLGCATLIELATQHSDSFQQWNTLREIGSRIQTLIGGRPFHPINLHVGGLSHYPSNEELNSLLPALEAAMPVAMQLAARLLEFEVTVRRETKPVFAALVPDHGYGYFGKRVRTTDGQEMDVVSYRDYLREKVVPYSHAKRSDFSGKSFMVGSMARIHLFHDQLQPAALEVYEKSPLANADTNSLSNNIAQAIEIVDALEQCIKLCEQIAYLDRTQLETKPHPDQKPGVAETVGAVECPRGTLYHAYTFDESGFVTAADMITPSAQNTARIELDIREVVSHSTNLPEADLQQKLETLIRAYDPCNTCATHMVQIRNQ